MAALGTKRPKEAQCTEIEATLRAIIQAFDETELLMGNICRFIERSGTPAPIPLTSICNCDLFSLSMLGSTAGHRQIMKLHSPPKASILASLLAMVGAPAQAQTSTDAARIDSGDFFTGFWRRPTMLGDMGGLRNILGANGVTINLVEQSEVLGSSTGGLKQGATYDGLTTLTLMLDTRKAFGWDGGSFNLSALQIHGRNLSQYYLDNLQTASGIEASPTTRLWEVWYQQAFLNGRLDVKIGQQSLDQEFMASQGSALFINTMMGWPMVPSANLYAGGPAYPLSSLGVRVQGQLTDNITALAGVFQDNPPGGVARQSA